MSMMVCKLFIKKNYVLKFKNKNIFPSELVVYLVIENLWYMYIAFTKRPT